MKWFDTEATKPLKKLKTAEIELQLWTRAQVYVVTIYFEEDCYSEKEL